MKPVIGIISYFPNNVDVRAVRIRKLFTLLSKCKQLFNLPVIIIAQNWKSELLENPDTIIYQYDEPLGITGARKELRRKFLASDYDMLIMLDDDCEIVGNSGQEYLKQLYSYPGCFIEFKKTLLKLFAISKDVFELVDFDDTNPENGDGFEDRIFVNTLRKKYPDKRKLFINTGLTEHSIATADVYSTWFKNQNLKSMLEKTFNKIDNIK